MKRTAAVTLLAAGTLAACGSSSSVASGTGPSRPAADCQIVDAAILGSIAEGAEKGTGMKPVAGAAVKSPDYENVYFIAMRFQATGVEPQVGVWASNSLRSGGGLILSVDGLAKQFTVWPDSSTTAAAIRSTDPAVDQAKACLA